MSSTLTNESLAKILGREVPELYLTIAKSSVLGLEPETIAQTLGVPKSDVDAMMEEQDYKDVRLLVGAEQVKERVERDYGWDGIESIAVGKLARRATLENDTDTLLRIAAVANKAVRRTAPPKESVLDPSLAAARVPLTLTRRFTEKLNNTGVVTERTQEEQISVLDGSAVNPTFRDVQSLLRKADEPSLSKVLTQPEKETIQTLMAPPAEEPEEEEFSVASLREMAKGFRT